MIEICDIGLGDYRALQGGEVLAEGDRFRETKDSGHVLKRKYYAPTAVVLADVLQHKLMALYLHAKAVIDDQEAWYSKGEQYLWPEIEAEVAAYEADNNVIGRNLSTRAALGQPVSKQATENGTKAIQLVIFIGAVLANRSVHKDAIQVLVDAADLDGVLAYDFSAGWPEL